MKKKLIIIVSILIFIIVSAFVYLSNKNTLMLKETLFIFELGDDIPYDVNYYLHKSTSNEVKKKAKLKIDENYLIDTNDKKIKTDGLKYLDAGEYSFSIVSGDKSVSFDIKVEDTTKPKFVEASDEIIIEENALNVDLINYFSASDLSDTTIIVDSDYDIKTAGNYKATVKVIDLFKNEISKEIKIKVIKYSDLKNHELTPTIDGTIYKSQHRIDEENKPKETYKNPTSSTTKKEDAGTNKNNNTNTSSTSNNNNNVSKSTYRKDIANNIFNQINSYRQSNGLSILPHTEEAQKEADKRVLEIVDSFTHNSSFGFGENLAKGTIGLDYVSLWKDSHLHNQAMLREQNTAMAVSVYEHNNTWYIVASFRMNY